MKKKLIFMSLFLIMLVPINCFANKGNLEIAKEYEGTFYSNFINSNWSPFSDAGVSLGEPVEIDIPEDIEIKYYINKDEDYVIQYLRTDKNMSMAIWKDGTLESLVTSK